MQQQFLIAVTYLRVHVPMNASSGIDKVGVTSDVQRGCGGATVPGIQPLGLPTTQFSYKSVGKCLKCLKRKKGNETGNPGYGGIPKKVVRIF